MLQTTWDSAKRRLSAGLTYRVPDDVSAADAAVLVARGVARPAPGDVPGIDGMTKAEIAAELEVRGVPFARSARRADLAALLADARRQGGA